LYTSAPGMDRKHGLFVLQFLGNPVDKPLGLEWIEIILAPSRQKRSLPPKNVSILPARFESMRPQPRQFRSTHFLSDRSSLARGPDDPETVTKTGEGSFWGICSMREKTDFPRAPRATTLRERSTPNETRQKVPRLSRPAILMNLFSENWSGFICLPNGVTQRDASSRGLPMLLATASPPFSGHK